MCQTKSHDTGWKVVKIVTGRYWDQYGIYSGDYVKCTWLYLRCRTNHCIETKVKRIDGHWKLSDFKDQVMGE